MTTKELEEANKAEEVRHLPQERLEAAAERLFANASYVDPPDDFMAKTQDEAEKLSD